MSARPRAGSLVLTVGSRYCEMFVHISRMGDYLLSHPVSMHSATDDPGYTTCSDPGWRRGHKVTVQWLIRSFMSRSALKLCVQSCLKKEQIMLAKRSTCSSLKHMRVQLKQSVRISCFSSPFVSVHRENSANTMKMDKQSAPPVFPTSDMLKGEAVICWGSCSKSCCRPTSPEQ